MEQGQSRAHSLAEAVTNVAVGLGVALAGQIVIFPLYDIHVSLGTNLQISAWFTAISIARSYVIRRIANRVTVRRGAAKAARHEPPRAIPEPAFDPEDIPAFLRKQAD